MGVTWWLPSIQSGAKVCFGASFEKGTPRAGAVRTSIDRFPYSGWSECAALSHGRNRVAASDEWPYQQMDLLLLDPGQSPWSSTTVLDNNHWLFHDQLDSQPSSDGTWWTPPAPALRLSGRPNDQVPLQSPDWLLKQDGTLQHEVTRGWTVPAVRRPG